MTALATLQSQFDGGTNGILMLPVAGYIWQDEDKTVPASEAGDPVFVIECAAGSGVEWRAESNSVRATLVQSSGVLKLDTTNARFLQFGAANIDRRNYSMIWAIDNPNFSGTTQRAFESSGNTFRINKSSSNLVYVLTAGGRTANYSPNGVDPGNGILSVVTTPTTLKTWQNNILHTDDTFSAVSSANLTQINRVFSGISGSSAVFPLDSLFSGMILIEKSMTEQDRVDSEGALGILSGSGSPPDPDPEFTVRGLWVGHTTTNSTTITASVQDATNIKLIFATDAEFNSVVAESDPAAVNSFGFVRFTVAGLSANTKYYVAVVDTDTDDINTVTTAEFTTVTSGVHSFKFGTASCANTGSTEIIFDTIRGDNLDFFVHTGDIHYADIGTNNVSLFHSAIEQVFASARQRDLWSSLPMYYMWDDHDYGPNDSHKDSPQRPAAVEFYRDRVPSPTLINTDPDGAVYYSFVRGRVRFIATDLRSERFNKGTFPSLDPQQLMMSQAQLDWFKSELDSANTDGHAICWINTVPWIEAVTNGSDAWGGYAAQRQEIADYITQQGYGNRIFIVSGDMHRLAFDDGTSVNNDGSLYVVQSAPLDRTASSKGGPYLVGPLGGSGTISQYSTIDVTDAGGETITITVDGFSVNRANGDKTLSYTETFNLLASPAAQNTIQLTVTGIPDGVYSVDLLPVGGGIEDWFRVDDVVFTGGNSEIETLLAVDDALVGIVYTDTDLPATGAGLYAVVTNGS